MSKVIKHPRRGQVWQHIRNTYNYTVLNSAKLRNYDTNSVIKWRVGVIYSDGSQTYIREMADFVNSFTRIH